MPVYLLLKVIHICAVIIFLGNIITGLFWMAHAKKTRDFGVINHTMRGIIRSDRWFTIPGVLIIVIGGFSAAIHAGIPILRTGWIFWSIVLFTFSGLAFAWRVAPLQQKIYKLTRDVPGSSKDNANWHEFERQYKSWELWGAIALITPLAALVMMILKIPVTTFFFK
jgi:uncharacterized membrane protein